MTGRPLKASRYNKVLGLALGERSMQVAEVSAVATADKPEARLLAEFEYPAGVTFQDPPAMGAALAEFLRQKGFTAKQVVIGLPARLLLVKTKEVPPADAATVSDLLRLQAEGEFSSELRDLVFDYAGEPTTERSQNVLLVATQQRYMELAEQLCEAAKLQLISVTSSAAALGAVTTRAATNKNAVVLALTPHAAELSALNAGQPTSLRHLRPPGQGGQEPLFLSELRRAVSMLPMNGSSGGREMIVWDGADVDAETFGENLGLPVRFGDLPVLGVRTADATRNGAGRKYAPAVALAMAAVSGQRMPVDFLHSRLAPPAVRVVQPWMVWGAVAALVLVALGVWGYASLLSQRKAFADATAKFAGMTDHVKTATANVSRVTFAERWEAGDPRYLACLADLTALIPEDGQTYITSLSIKEKEIRRDEIQKAVAAGKAPPVPGLQITVSGNAPNNQRAQDLFNAMKDRRDWFTDVNLGKVVAVQQAGVTGRRDRGGESNVEVNFTLTCTFIVPEPAKQTVTASAATSGAAVRPAASSQPARR